MKYASGTILMFICLFVLATCSAPRPTTTITGSWKAPDAKSYQTFFVVVLNKKLQVRSALEGEVARMLKKQDVKAAKSLDILGKDEKIETPEEKKAAVEKIQSMNYDAIVTVALLKYTEEKVFVPGVSSYSPANVGVGSGYYNPATGANQSAGGHSAFGMYYMDGGDLYNAPGHYETTKVYFIESNVYEANGAKLVWSAQSEAFYAGDLNKASRDFATAIVQAVKQAGLIRKD
jgi:hypothetical protein